jgi:hypothetical protein
MRLLKQAMAVLGAVVVIAVIVVLVTPKTAHAVIATLVQVVNTSAQPVPILNASAANEPFFASLCKVAGTGIVFSPNFCPPHPGSFQVPQTTPDGAASVKRLVIEFVTAQCATHNGTLVDVELITDTPFPARVYNFVPFSTGAVSSGNVSAVSQPTSIYANPNETYKLDYIENGDDALCQATVSGYFITQ